MPFDLCIPFEVVHDDPLAMLSFLGRYHLIVSYISVWRLSCHV
jgi:hypothetical protein